MNAADLKEGERYLYRDKILIFSGRDGRSWYFEWGARIVVCLWASELSKLKPL